MFIVYWILGSLCSLLVTAVIIILIIAALQPSAFRIERSGEIAAPTSVVFPLLNDFHQWKLWSPWERMDPNLKRDFDGPESGVGAKFHWSGNKKTGEGRMTILESKVPELVTVKLEFLKPFVATNQATFNITPSGNTSRVTWAMTGNRNLLMKAFCLFMNMDKIVGTDFEKGLANLNEAAQSPPPQKHNQASLT